MRQSIAANKTNHASTQAAAIQRLLEKKKEYDAVSALEKASTLYLQRMEGLAGDLDVMADAGQVHGQVLEQWPRMFQILNLFLNSRSSEQLIATENTEGERLVRIPVEELQQASKFSRLDPNLVNESFVIQRFTARFFTHLVKKPSYGRKHDR